MRHISLETCWSMIPAAVVGLFLFLAGCARGPAVTRPEGPPEVGFPNHSVDYIQEALRKTVGELHTLEGIARVDIQTADNRRSFNAHIRQRMGDSLWMSITHRWFGVEAAVALATPDSIFVHDRVNNRIYFGPLELARKLAPALGSLEHVFATLTGTLYPSLEKSWTLRADSSRYYLRSHSDTSGFTYTVNPRTWNVTKVTETGPDGDPVEVREFLQFERVAGVSIPHQIVIRRPPTDHKVTLTYQSISPNPPAMQFPFQVDPEARRIPLASLR